MQRLRMTLFLVIGSFLVYCSQSATMNDPDGGPTADADTGGSCCAAAPFGFTKLAEGDLVPNTPSPAIAVGAYRELVVYITVSPCHDGVDIRFRADASSPFGRTGQYFNSTEGARLRVDGTDMQLRGPEGCTVHYVVAGVQ